MYFVQRGEIVKVEVVDLTPETPSPTEYDELFGICLMPVEPGTTFNTSGEPGMWYRVFGQQEMISSIDIVRTVVVFPSEDILHPAVAASSPSVGMNLVDCGILIHLETGILPAVVRNNSFGFSNWPETRLHTAQEISAILGESYEIISLGKHDAA